MGTNIPTIIGVTSAHRNQGKTQLVMRIVEGLTKEGFTIGTIKHIGANSTYDDSKIKDTSRHAEAGAKLVIAVTNSELILTKKVKEPSIEIAIQQFPKDYDFIVVEGFKKRSYPRFIIIDKADEIEGLNETGPVLGLTGHIAQNKEELKKLDKLYPVIQEKDTEALLTIVKNRRHYEIVSMLPSNDCGDCGFEGCEEMANQLLLKNATFDKCPHLTKILSVTIDGKDLYMKDFVQNIVRKGIEGMLETLKGVPRDPDEIIIKIKSDSK